MLLLFVGRMKRETKQIFFTKTIYESLYDSATQQSSICLNFDKWSKVLNQRCWKCGHREHFTWPAALNLCVVARPSLVYASVLQRRRLSCYFKLHFDVLRAKMNRSMKAVAKEW